MPRFVPRLTYALTLLCLMVTGTAGAQHVLTVSVFDGHERTPLIGASVLVEGTTIGATTDASGRARVLGIPAGEQTIVISHVGFRPQRLRLTFPLADPETPRAVYLDEAHGHVEGITVMATRTSRTIADTPTRVEVIAGEGIDEKIIMRPGNISMLLNESPGIMVQQTSAVTGNAAIRIQGLDGRYTQLLKDGFPLFGGYAGGLSLLQVPPLDLAQVEIIKGPASTLFGGDAIAGLVNLVSKRPAEEPERLLLLNATSAGGFDGGTFMAGRGERLGYTLLGSLNLQRAYDADDDAFTNLPATTRLTLSPRLFAYGGHESSLMLGVDATIEEREGGDVAVVRDGTAGFFERHASRRLTGMARLDHELGEGRLTLKTSASLFDREITIPGLRFDGRQLATYSEASHSLSAGHHALVAGLDLRSDAFRENAPDAPRDYTHLAFGAFAQDTWDIAGPASVELGLRADHHNTYGTFILPRASVLYRITDALSARAGGGLGYKAPTIFLEPSEERVFRAVDPIGEDVRAETSRGGSVDVNYRLALGELALSLNQALHYTEILDALVPDPFVSAAGRLRYHNAEGTVSTRSLETNIRVALDDLSLFLGYVNLDTRDAEGSRMALTPEHRTYTVLVYEQHGRGRIGLEAYYTGPQRLPGGNRTSGYWVTGIMGERRFGPVSVFANFENLLDTRQGDFGPVVSGPRSEPTFAPIWAPMDGFIVNGGVKVAF
jgi:outer membrane receptor for ferrienterochelin and colicins